MLVTLIEVVEQTRQYSNTAERNRQYTLREVTVNPNHVVCLREDQKMLNLLTEGGLPEGLDSRQEFTRVYLDRGQSGIDLTVVGSVNTIKRSLGIQQAGVLNG